MPLNLETLARIWGRCTVISYVVLLIWFGAHITGFLCDMYGPMFDLTPHECAVVNYGGIGLMKILVLVFFLFPWCAMRLELRRR